MTERKNIKYITIIIVLMLAAFVVLRPVNHDETYYLISSKSFFFEGMLPYIDFIFHQMPLMIFAYLPVSAFGFWSLPLGRILSCIFLFAGYIIFLKTFKARFTTQQVILFTVLFWINLFLIDWAVTVKVYSLSILLISGGIYFYSRYLENITAWKQLAMSSLFFSLLIFAKVAFAANYFALAVFTIYVLASTRDFKKIILGLCSVLAPLVILTIFFFIFAGTDFERLYFNLFEINLFYKHSTSFSEDLLKYMIFFIIPQNLILLVLMMFSFYNFDKMKFFLFLNIVFFLCISLETRLLMEYNASIVPLMIILAVFGFETLALKLKKLSAGRLAAFLLIFYCICSPLSISHIKQYISSGKLPLNPVEMYSFTEKINSLPGNTVLSGWEGLSAFSSKQTLHEQNYAISYVSDYIDKPTKEKFNLFIREDYKKLVDNADADIIIFDASNAAHLSGLDDNIRTNYKAAFEYKYITVFVKK